jgi:hypothetical protein
VNYSFIGGDRSGWVRIFDKSKKSKPSVKISGADLIDFLEGHRKADHYGAMQRNLEKFYKAAIAKSDEVAAIVVANTRIE